MRHLPRGRRVTRRRRSAGANCDKRSRCCAMQSTPRCFSRARCSPSALLTLSKACALGRGASSRRSLLQLRRPPLVPTGRAQHARRRRCGPRGSTQLASRARGTWRRRPRPLRRCWSPWSRRVGGPRRRLSSRVPPQSRSVHCGRPPASRSWRTGGSLASGSTSWRRIGTHSHRHPSRRHNRKRSLSPITCAQPRSLRWRG
mmetsp:Transcript_36122/g.118997  ORF Transcript_36122/g.118997 Transcript_36122/m.118997 type:complete len:201 (+) Transcript_36122:1166-1768(+)